MSGSEQTPLEWVRQQVEGDLGIARHILDKRGGRPDPRREMYDAIADCEAKLAILDLCQRVGREDGGKTFDGDFWTGIAVARMTLRFMLYGYRHREGFREEWNTLASLEIEGRYPEAEPVNDDECADADEETVRALLAKHGYDPDLLARGVAGGPGRFNGYKSAAGQIVPTLLRNHVCELESVAIDGHSDPDRSGICIYCSKEMP